jgi:hypothetical protein
VHSGGDDAPGEQRERIVTDHTHGDGHGADDAEVPGTAKEAQSGEEQTDAAAETPLNGGAHVASGSFTSTREEGVDYDGAFTDSDIPADDIKPGETEVDRAGFEGAYTESDGVD